jgi:geranylgeranyl diphosphate synthase, type II
LDYKSKYENFLLKIEKALKTYILPTLNCDSKIYEIMNYSLSAGGKRLRPVMAVAVNEIFEGKLEDILPFACGIEMIHTYSLIHDDLPAMDNDDYRRGKPSNHKVFGEGMAVLAGDSLLNTAFEIMLRSCMESFNENNTKKGIAKVKAMEEIAKASGIKGMIKGQIMDLEYEGKMPTEELLKGMHQCKTGALIKASIVSSAIIQEASEKEIEYLEQYGEYLGLAFQIKDDILDVKGTFKNMGKPVGSDSVKEKATYVSLYGIKKSEIMLEDATNKAILSLKYFGNIGKFLNRLAIYMLNREK